MKNIKKKFDDIDKAYGKENSGDVEYKAQDYVSSSEIENEAKAYANNKNEEKKNDVVREVYDYIEGLKSKKKEVDSGVKDKMFDIDKEYDELKQNVENSMLKKGLARSSIKNEAVVENDKNRALEKLEAQESANNVKKEINEEIDETLKKQDAEIKSIEDSFLLEVQNKINELEREKDKKISDIKKHNREVSDIKNTIGVSEVENFLTESEKRREQALLDEKLDIAKSYYGGMDKSDAYKMFTLDEAYLKDNLKGNYDALKKYLIDKK